MINDVFIANMLDRKKQRELLNETKTPKRSLEMSLNVIEQNQFVKKLCVFWHK